MIRQIRLTLALGMIILAGRDASAESGHAAMCDTENPLVSQICDLAADQIVCNLYDLTGYCSLSSSTMATGGQPSPLCASDPSSETNSISWVGFVALEGEYEIKLDFTDCEGSVQNETGMQVGVYGSCDFTDLIYCNTDCNTGAVVIPSEDLVPGLVYYLFLNACSSTICSYTMEVVGPAVDATLFIDDICIEDDTSSLVCDDVAICPGVSLDFVLTGIDIDLQYHWTVTTQSGGPYSGDLEPVTEAPSLMATFDEMGEYMVCIEFGSNGCDVTASPPRCIAVEVRETVDEEFPTQFVCEGDLESFDISVFSDISSPENDPNGDGFFGWAAPLQTWIIGENTGLVEDDFGCSYQQTFELIPIICDTVSTYDLLPQKPYRIAGEETLSAQSNLWLHYYTIAGGLVYSQKVLAGEQATLRTDGQPFLLQIIDTDANRVYTERVFGY